MVVVGEVAETIAQWPMGYGIKPGRLVDVVSQWLPLKLRRCRGRRAADLRYCMVCNCTRYMRRDKIACVGSAASAGFPECP